MAQTEASAGSPPAFPAPSCPVSRSALPLEGVGADGQPAALTVLRFGALGARPKAYLQAGLHADEFPGMLALRHLAARLQDLAARGEIAGEIILVPQANPLGLAQHRFGFLQGRFHEASGANFNRGYPDLAAVIGDEITPRLGPDPAANVAAIRDAMGAALAGMAARGEMERLRLTLMGLAYDADIVLDLHADNEALLHLYVGTPLWPDAQDIAAEIGARAVLLAEVSGGNPFDEACSGPWWTLAKRFPHIPIPPACLSATLELRCNDTVDDALAARDAAALEHILRRRGMIAGGEAEALPPLLCEATPLEAMQQLRSPAYGLIAYGRRLGDSVQAGEEVARIIDPVGESVPVLAATDGLLFALHSQTYAWPGKVIGKIAGAHALPERTGRLLTD
ncbi:succinylglutamate desuccinylase/aspartoacylase family protein [Aquabacter sp. L1I39]|uniref:succinylglutamate desuccinylase/aspartoacylase family protein n=1 Tax=Aquabacter sp. L1I39 TaxID=2820278 RepID=UPI001ADA396D|nr:succinylglutamate desuccinylase/aspartoacylase family protein [Aquabacter sp. L1I39]QTL04065.1 succinylglutamate desuccinylase/aspartoacylase family protein [Aquabacter sp. L1I39]